MTAPTPPVPLTESQYVNQYSQETLALNINIAGAPGDPDGNLITVTMTQLETNNVVFTRTATREEAGLYTVTLSQAEASVPGDYTLSWVYAINSNTETFWMRIFIGAYSQAYSQLDQEMVNLVRRVWLRFADMFDSPAGGPNLQTYFQTRFNVGRLADLLLVAVGKLNTIAQPWQTYTLDGVAGPAFPMAQWGSLLEQACYVETVRHLRRSYLEQPQFMGGEIARLDRRDYFDRWGMILQEEQAEMKGQLDSFKISAMNLGKVKTLVSGGNYGRFGGVRYVAGQAAARGYMFWNRSYIILLVLMLITSIIAPWHTNSPETSQASSYSISTSGPISTNQGA